MSVDTSIIRLYADTVEHARELEFINAECLREVADEIDRLREEIERLTAGAERRA